MDPPRSVLNSSQLMEATFHIADGHDIEVRSRKQTRAVDLSVLLETNDSFDTKGHPSRQVNTLTPQVARALASALMGAAAEV